MGQAVRIKYLSNKLRAIRKHLGLSQSQLAARLKSQPRYGRVSEDERGKRGPTVLTLLDYARLGGIHVEDLIDDEIKLKF
jgi:transcriptional regulator with XRE-family HTH domain